ncbi:HNH endonuclease [Desulfococcus multivorans]|uniref:HNH endonuclease n=1 Tax=Desulfococcus multivorans DSM 2059 TaxID=1121405 RepID=S7T9I1_DESML|nr:HNH endonuclease [Desulfococcus multivorans]AQU99765.1 HNH endonuclease [Desulfococcus multivorans]EPR33266.1 HNH endonuclease [Desulfococcus multivorans DSM 2059]SKA21871.1 5-methylcytosine-specific restriction enzyme A [Desulfococcus multivorans DSM 2059]
MNNLKILPGETIDNNELCAIFKCSTQGGMRRSHKTGTLVIISNHVKSIYVDRRQGNILHYTGMGTKGDQSLEFMQNKTLAESGRNNIEVHLFEVFKAGEYTYDGRVELEEKPYTEPQRDAEGNSRLVWIFPLRLVSGAPPTIDRDKIENLKAIKDKMARSLSDQELEARAKFYNGVPDSREVSGRQFSRNSVISELAQRRAKGICGLCGNPAPFKRKDGTPYLETHHIIWLSEGGKDSIDNTVALCPNCHRKMHVIKSKNDVNKLKRR